MMSFVCSWCECELQSPQECDTPEDLISHGICDDCFNRVMNQNFIALDSFLNTLNGPVFVVNNVGRISAANEQGLTMLDRKVEDIRHYFGGEVFCCANAQLPEGCGNTIHCLNCEIRRTIMNTMETGQPARKAPATMNQIMAGEERPVRYHISTEKKGEAVLLQIDEVSNVR